MTLWELRELVEGSIPAWLLLIPVGTVVLAYGFHLVASRRPPSVFCAFCNREMDPEAVTYITRIYEPARPVCADCHHLRLKGANDGPRTR